ncbi:MAG: hypothetical protein JJ896_09865 [Rhodothermales bacterium]|nr:hypothetical protein [Rhodothermales bacterium]MBO6779946.1 hypothetical protein [Rhodothermales bacterium]
MLISLLCLLLPLAAAEPAKSLDPDKSIRQFVMDTWTMEEGLPNNAVGALLQTSDGYLWVGTDAGLARYNGITFTSFDRNPAFSSHEVRSLAESGEGALWAGTLTGVVVVDRSGARPLEALPRSVRVEALVPADDGEVWVGTWSNGLYRCREDACSHQGGADIGRIQGLRLGSGTLWIGTESGLFRLRPDDDGPQPVANGLVVSAMDVLPGGDLLVTEREGGVLRFDSNGRRVSRPEDANWPTERVWAVLADREGSLWFGVEGRSLLRMSGTTVNAFGQKEGLPGTRVLSITEDREGSVWVGTEGGGLLRFRNGAFTTIDSQSGLAEEYVTTVSQGPDGAMLAGTFGGGLHVLDPEKLMVRERIRGLPSANVTGVLPAADGSILVASIDAGVSRVVGSRVRSIPGLPSQSVYALHRARNGEVWIGTDAGLVRLSDSGTSVYTEDDGLGSNSIVDIEDDGAGRVWVGTYGGGLTVFNPDGTTRTYNTEDGLDSDIVSALHLDREGVLWIGTLEGGLSMLDNGHIENFSIRDGLFDRSVFQILEDDFGFLWMGSNRGISRVRKADILAYRNGGLPAIPHEAFGTDDGLKSPEINGGAQPAGWKSTDGRLWFPSIAGVAVVDPSDLSRNTVPPPVVIERVEADGVAIAVGSEVELAPGTRRLEFKFAALSLVDASAIKYRFRLRGEETEWNTTMAGNTATYTFLDPGTYTFQVAAANNDGVWNEDGASLSFTLKPYLFQTSWFWMLIASAGFMAGAWFFRSRTEQLKRQRTELEQMVEERTRDVLAARDQILAQSDALRASLRDKEVLLREVHHRVKNNLQMISSLLQLQSRQVTDHETKLLFEECRNRIYSFSMVHERLYRSKDMAHFDFVEYLSGVAHALVRSHHRRDREIELEVRVDPGDMDVDKVIPCGLIVTEFVTNALRHAFNSQAHGTIWVNFSRMNETGLLTVEDDGLGLSPDISQERRDGLGLNLVDALVTRLKGHLRVEARPEGGTRCVVHFPLSDATPAFPAVERTTAAAL